MKKKCISILLLVTQLMLAEEIQSPEPIQKDPIVQLSETIKTVHFHNNIDIINNNMPKILIEIWNSATATTNTFLSKTHDSISSNLDFLLNTIIKHKKRTAAFAALSCFGISWLYMHSLQNSTFNAESWGAWKSHIPLSVLLSSPQQEVAKELILDIQKKYTSTEKLTDFISPLVQFMNTIDKEKNYLERYLFLQKWLDRLYLAKLLPHDEKAIAKAHEKVDRLLYLRQLLISWISEYKIQTSSTKQKDMIEDVLC